MPLGAFGEKNRAVGMRARVPAHLRLPLPAAIAVLAAASLASVALGGCKKRAADGPSDAAASLDPIGDAQVVSLVPADAGADGAAPSVTLHALAFITQVMSAPEWAPHDPSKANDERKGVIRLGYLRKGATVAARPELIKKQSCLEGWYELLPAPGTPPGTGGFVCGKYATLDANDKELASAPHPPSMAGPLPYDYGLNLVNGAPLYRRIAQRRERDQYEAGLAVGRSARHKDDDDDEGSSRAGAGNGSADAAWYLAHKDRSQLTMDDLKGETGLIALRMVRGFYLALDTQVHTHHAGTFWRTTEGMFVPRDFILVHQPKVELEGVWLNAPGEARHLPLAWITGPHRWKYTFDDDGKPHRHEQVDRFTVVQLTGQSKVVDDRGYWETADGWWMRDVDGSISRPGPPPKGLAPGERWIDVNLGQQSLVAFEGDKPVFATIVSTGRHDDDPAKDHSTRPGEFRIREKHIAATMDADTASDGPYSIEDVPWIMYFDGSTALHGAFWHSRFGHERSHGCVNMTPHDAHELFGWVGPALPPGWHGVRATDANPGTRVVVHYDGKTAEESRKSYDESRDATGKDAGR